MLNLIIMVGLFLLIAFIVSLTLSLATSEENPRAILQTTMKNFNLLCLIILVICIIVSIINTF
ncbi:MAG: hypothetical protein HZA49_07920 [Planctomycetes bacterium]|nr:hypothetical protein [Planctomycetota bacterium]